MMFGFLQNIFGVNPTTQTTQLVAGNNSPQSNNSIFSGYTTVGNALAGITVDSNLSYPNMFPNIGNNPTPVSNSYLLVGDSLLSIANAIANNRTSGTSLTQQLAPTTPATPATPTAPATPSQASENAQPAAANNATVSMSGNKVKLSATVINKVKNIAQKINCDYKDLIGVIYAESRWKTDNWNGRSAVGLIQFTQTCIDDLNQIYHLNLTKEKIAKMNIMQQLDLAEKSLMRAKKIAGFPSSHRLTASELYAMNLYPANAKRSYCVLRRGERGYASNRGLDLDKDGKITPNEIASIVNQGKMQVVC